MKIRTYNKNKAWLWLIFISFIVIFIWGINSERTQQDNFQSRKALVLNEVYTNREQGISDKKWLCDWIEIYNGTEQNILLKDYGLSDEKEVPGKWRFPDAVIESGEYLVVALDELGVSDAYSLVADFTLNKNGDYIYLSDEKDYIIDEVKIPELDENQSFGRYPDGAEQFQKFVSISPGEVNRKNHLQNDFWVDYNEKVEFSIEGGYFDEEIEVALSVKNPDAEIYYTLDGSEPDENSLHYTKTIKVGSRAEEPNKYTNIEADTDGTTCLSTSPVYKGTVIRARAYLDGRQSDNITTNTYFYCPDYTVPIVSLVTNPDNLFGYKEGIYVPGIDYYYGIRSRNGEINIGNYYRKGKIGKKRVHIEVFEIDGDRVVSQDMDVKISGLRSRSYKNKSFSLSSRKEYNNHGTVKYDLFGKRNSSQLTCENIDEYKTFLLRNLGGMDSSLFYKDAVIQEIMRGDEIATRAYQPCVLFINAEYWGLYNIRENIDEYYLNSHFGVDSNNIDLIEIEWKEVQTLFDRIILKLGEQRALTEYKELWKYVQMNDMSEYDKYSYVKKKIDLENLAWYYLIELYFGNNDWLDNNTRIWKSDDIKAKYGDNKWRYILFDLDEAWSEYDENPFVILQEKKEYAAFFESLMVNTEFREMLINMYKTASKDIFSSENLNASITRAVKKIEPELEEHFERWSESLNLVGRIMSLYKSWEIPNMTLDIWHKELDDMREFAEKRPAYFEKYLMEYVAQFED